MKTRILGYRNDLVVTIVHVFQGCFDKYWNWTIGNTAIVAGVLSAIGVFQVHSCYIHQWIFPQLSIMIIFNSTWPFLIQWIRVRIVRWHADLAYIKISIISVCNKPYYTHQGNVQKGEEICGTVHSNIMQVYQNYDNRFWNIFSRDRDLKVFKHFGLAFHFLPSQRKRLAVLHDIDISYPCVCLWEHFMRCVFWICSSCCWFCRPLPSWNSRTATKSSRQAVTTGSDVGMLVVTSAITSLKDMVWCRILL